MRKKGSWSSNSFKAAAAEASSKGSATFRGEQRAREGKGLDPLVDPRAHGVIRLSLNLMVPEDGQFVLPAGVAMPVKTDLDTTGSMGGNVDIAFRSLPKVLNLLAQGDKAVLKRYHPQIATGVVQDVGDRFPYQVSQFEPDNEIDRQMGMLVPERGGGDAAEDYQLGLYSTARLTRTSLSGYGLKGYYFAVGDVTGRDRVEPELLRRVFGPEKIDLQGPLSTVELGKELLEKWHGFFLQVGSDDGTSKWWKRVLGAERVVHLPRTEDLAEVQACLIGLCEGLVDLQSAPEFLRAGTGIDQETAKRIVRACAGTPVGAQAALPGFRKIPLAGARFARRDDLWPIGTPGAPVAAPPAPDGKGQIEWKM